MKNRENGKSENPSLRAGDVKSKPKDIIDIFDEQFSEIVKEICSWNERSVLIFDGEKFSVVNDFGNTTYHYDRNIHSPSIMVKTFRNVFDTAGEDDFWSLLHILNEKGVKKTSKELQVEIEKEGFAEVAKKYDVPMDEILRKSAEAEIAEYLREIQDEIVEIAEEIAEKIEEYEHR